MAGATGAVLEVLERAGPGLLDVPWLERSRALAGVRGDARFQAVLRQVSERAHAVWA